MSVAVPVWLQPATTPFTVIAIGASAGGLRAVQSILAQLDDDFPAPILLAQHRGPGSLTAYRRLLGAVTKLAVVVARSGELVMPGCVYIAPDDCHLEVATDGTVLAAPRTVGDFTRPSVDRLFESVGNCYGKRAMAVVLTGYGRDGARGVRAMRGRGGFVLAQDKRTCEQAGMPAAAIETRRVDLVLPLSAIAFALQSLTTPNEL